MDYATDPTFYGNHFNNHWHYVIWVPPNRPNRFRGLVIDLHLSLTSRGCFFHGKKTYQTGEFSCHAMDNLTWKIIAEKNWENIIRLLSMSCSMDNLTWKDKLSEIINDLTSIHVTCLAVFDIDRGWLISGSPIVMFIAKLHTSSTPGALSLSWHHLQHMWC